MMLSIKIKSKIVEIKLKRDKKIIDETKFAEDYNLSEKLLPEIDKLLRKNKLTPRDIKNVFVRTDAPESFTTSRIAHATGKAWNFAAGKA